MIIIFVVRATVLICSVKNILSANVTLKILAVNLTLAAFLPNQPSALTRTEKVNEDDTVHEMLDFSSNDGCMDPEQVMILLLDLCAVPEEEMLL
jgi:hypothetical protein